MMELTHELGCRQMTWSVIYSMCAVVALCVTYRITSCHPAQAAAKHPIAHKAGRFNNTLERPSWACPNQTEIYFLAIVRQ